MKRFHLLLAILSVLFNGAMARDVAAGDLDDGRALYESVASVHMKADLKIRRAGVFGTGSYEYWADGDRYRMKCSSDPALGLMGDVQYAYDGLSSQQFYESGDMLVQRTGDITQLPTAIPNPFFLPIDHVNPDGDACPGCTIKLRDAKNIGKPAPTRTREGSVLTPRVRDGLIKWLRTGGSVATSIAFERSGTDFPRRIVMKGFDEAGHMEMELEALMHTVEINGSISPDVFTIPAHVASQLWDEDERAFVPTQ